MGMMHNADEGARRQTVGLLAPHLHWALFTFKHSIMHSVAEGLLSPARDAVIRLCTYETSAGAMQSCGG